MPRRLSYTDYLYIRHRLQLVAQRVFPSAKVRIEEDYSSFSMGYRVTLYVPRGGHAVQSQYYLDAIFLDRCRDTEQVFRDRLRHAIHDIIKHLTEDTWQTV